MMAPASSIIFRMVPPWTFPAMLASSGRIILPKEADESSQHLPRPQPSPGAAARRQHVAHRLSCRAIAARMRFPVSGDGNTSRLSAGSGRKQDTSARAAGVSPGPHPAGPRCGTDRAGHVPVLHAAPWQQPRFLPTANNGPGGTEAAAERWPGQELLFEGGRAREPWRHRQENRARENTAALLAPSPRSTEHGRGAAALCPRPVSLTA